MKKEKRDFFPPSLTLLFATLPRFFAVFQKNYLTILQDSGLIVTIIMIMSVVRNDFDSYVDCIGCVIYMKYIIYRGRYLNIGHFEGLRTGMSDYITSDNKGITRPIR